LKAILAKLRPEPVREPLQPPKVYAPPKRNGCEQTAARVKRYRDPPVTLGNAAQPMSGRLAGARRHQVEPDPGNCPEGTARR